MRDSKLDIVERFFSGTGGSYDWIVNLNTFGFDRWWKGRILRAIPRDSALIVDQGCGTGILTLRIARRFPRARVIGVELRDEYLSRAREKARRQGIANVEFVLGRAEDTLVEGSVDGIASSYLAKYVEMGKLVRNASRMLRGGGVLVMHDFTYPRSPVAVRVWEFYLRALQKIGSRVSPEWREVYYGLPEFLRKTDWVGDLRKALQTNAFSSARVQYFTAGTSAIVTARKTTE
ncbi:MAG TPA: class I SAM-dependent methyltransferase [Thermodesulfobacteriota bacterium]|nr:class I SAM-dependent methyltransferase [Thermodesulfobacteriota bacterium]